MPAAIECRRCHKTVSLEDYLGEQLVPTDEICLECERRSAIACRECQAFWISANANFAHECETCGGTNALFLMPRW